MHKRRFSIFLIILKLFFLCLSIFFLARTALTTNKFHSIHSSSHTFTLDRNDPNLSQKIQSIDAYLASTTGQAVALATTLSWTTTLLLPATTDYELYKTYLHSITSAHNVQQYPLTGDTPPLSPEIITIESETNNNAWNSLWFIVSLLLALFL